MHLAPDIGLMVVPIPSRTLRAGLDLNGKPVAVFGLGDSVSYGEYFCDAMEEVYR